MNKTAFKIFICFALTAAVTATVLLGINLLGFALIGSDTNVNLHSRSPKGTLEQVSEAITKTDSGFMLPDGILPEDYWCILLDERGDIIWSQNQPEDIPVHYSINDVARMTRWFLNDYPVYVRTKEYGLLVLGIPKNTVGKYDMVYSMEWFAALPQRIIGILVINLCLAAILALGTGTRLYKRLRSLADGINDLRREKPVRLIEKGIFKELAKNINDTSQAVGHKNAALADRDSARSNWIAGISHDLRTPLSIVIGHSEALCESGELSEENNMRAAAITAQGIRIKKLIEDLNLISTLEYDMQPSKKTAVRICPLVRKVVTEIMNSGLSDQFEIVLDLRNEKAAVEGDENLLERAVYNLIHNSIVHNEAGCTIKLCVYCAAGTVCLDITDNGAGVPQEVLENLSKLPKSVHGLGLPMAYRIVYAHGGSFQALNEAGFTVKIRLPGL